MDHPKMRLWKAGITHQSSRFLQIIAHPGTRRIPLLFHREADGTLGDPAKIGAAVRKAQMTKLTEEEETRAQSTTNPEADETLEDTARLIGTGLNTLPSERNEEAAPALERTPTATAAESSPIYERTIEDEEDISTPSGLQPTYPSSSEGSITPTQLPSRQQFESQSTFHRQPESHNPFTNQTYWWSYPSRIPERIFEDLKDGSRRPELMDTESQTQQLPRFEHPQPFAKSDPVPLLPPQHRTTHKVPSSGSVGKTSQYRGAEGTNGINKEYRERTSKVLDALTKEVTSHSTRISSMDDRIDSALWTAKSISWLVNWFNGRLSCRETVIRHVPSHETIDEYS